LPLLRIPFVGVLLLAALSVRQAGAQNNSPTPNLDVSNSNKDKPTAGPIKQGVAQVTGVRVVHERGVPALEVLSTLPAVPSIQFLDSPPRLVVDLLHARISLPQKKIEVHEDNILGVRAEQHQADPPVVRIVLDLRAPYGYTWDEAGNRLMVRLKPPEDVNASKHKHVKPAAELGLASSLAVVPVATGPPEAVIEEAGLVAGSSLTAGADTSVLRLSRGGEVRICAGTTVSVTPSKSAKDLMLGMSTGSLETHYTLGESADTVLTPDFRILFAGPGEFDFAISTDTHGNTCVRGLTGNSSSAIVSELMGDRIYQVKPTEQVVFREGRIDKIDSHVPLECGCPPPVPVMRAEENGVGSGAGSGRKDALSAGSAAAASNEAPSNNPTAGNQKLSNGPETRPLPPTEADAIHVQVEAPFVFRGKKSSAPPIEEAALLPVMEPRPQPPLVQIQPPPPPQNTSQHNSASHGFLGRIKGFFVTLFG
jgi:hypothetical protein